MSKLSGAARAERYKLWRKKSAKWTVAALAVISVLLTLLCFYIRLGSARMAVGLLDNVHGYNALTDIEHSEDRMGDIKRETAKAIDLRRELEQDLISASPARANVIKSLIAKAQWKEQIGKYRLKNGIEGGADSPWQTVILCMWLMLPLIAALSAVFASDMFAGEFERGTIRLILSRPLTRSRIYTAKIITSQLYGLLCVAVTFAASAITSAMLYGDNVEKNYIGCFGGKVYTTTWARYAFSILLCCVIITCVLLFFCAFVGNLTRSRTFAISATALLAVISIYLGEAAGSVCGRLSGVNIIAALDLTKLIAGQPNAAQTGYWAILLSTALHAGLFCSLGYRAFRRDV